MSKSEQWKICDGHMKTRATQSAKDIMKAMHARIGPWALQARIEQQLIEAIRYGRMQGYRMGKRGIKP